MTRSEPCRPLERQSTVSEKGNPQDVANSEKSTYTQLKTWSVLGVCWMPPHSSLSYRPEIDGLRAVAVLAVVLNHTSFCPGGYVGVDVFFVISGYLITSILLRSIAADEFSLWDFWERRVRRIVPALVMTIVLVLAMGWWQFLPRDFERLARATLAQVICASNVIHWRMSGYFAPDAETLPLLHTWSLAVEEQFYFLLPTTLWLTRNWSRKTVVSGLALVCVLSFTLCVWATAKMPSAAFYLLPTRAWELLMGTILSMTSLRSQPIRPILAQITSLMGLAAIIFPMCYYDEKTIFPGLPALLPCSGAIAFLWSNSLNSTWAGRVLSIRPVVFIGLISYSLYLLHWPLIVSAMYWHREEMTWPLRAGIVAISIVAATLSWRWIETPIRKKQVFSQAKSAFAASFLGLIMCFMAGLCIELMNGAPQRFSEQMLRYTEQTKSRFSARRYPRDVADGQLDTIGVEKGTIDCLVWGDSHAHAFLPYIDMVCREYGLHGESAIHTSTAPLLNYVSTGPLSLKTESPLFNEAVVSRVIQKRVRAVVIAARWFQYADNPKFEECLIATTQRLTDAGIQVVLVKDVPYQSGNIPRLLSRAVYFGQDVSSIGVPLARHTERNQLVNQSFARLNHPLIRVIDPAPFFVDDRGLCRGEMNGESLYFDAQHLSVAGSLLTRPLFELVLYSLVESGDSKTSTLR